MSSTHEHVRDQVRVQTYGADLRYLLQLSDLSMPRPLPARLAPRGSLARRLEREHARMHAEAPARLIIPAGVKVPSAPGNPQLLIVRPRTYARALLSGAAYPHLAILSTLTLPDLRAEEREELDDALAETLWRRYEGFLLPEPLAHAILRILEDSANAHLVLDRIEAVRAEYGQCAVSLVDAASRRAAYRAALLDLGAEGVLADPEIAVLEMFCDLQYLQRVSLEQLLEAEATRRSGQTRAERLDELEADGDLFDQLLPTVLHSESIRAAIRAERLPDVIAFTSRRAPVPPVLSAHGGSVAATVQRPAAEPRKATGPTPSTPEPPTPVPPESPTLPAFSPEPLPWRGNEPSFRIPEWAPLGLGELAPETLCRSVFVTGGTGAGKTASCIVPLAAAALRYPGPGADGGLAPAMLVLDPKAEVTARLEHITHAEGLSRILVRGETTQLHIFEGEDPLSLTPGMIVERVFGLSEAWQREARGRNPFFADASARVLEELVAVDAWLYRTGGGDYLSACWDAVGEALDRGDKGIRLRYDAGRYWQVLIQFISVTAYHREAVRAYLDVCAAFGAPRETTLPIAAWDGIPSDTWGCIVATLANVAREAAGASPLWLNPFEAPPESQALRVLQALDAGWCVTYRPTPGSTMSSYTLRSIKSIWFRLALQRPTKTRPLLVVIDEMQRVVSGDASSEAMLLDVCRAHRIGVIAATPSVAALRLALAGGEGHGQDAAINAMLSTIGTRLFFRSTDPESQTLLEQLLPAPPMAGRPHVARARPLTTLAVGEAIVLKATGGWARKRIRLRSPP